MKKYTRFLTATLFLLCLLCTTAFASNYDNAAQELKTLGLFQGATPGSTGPGATRTEARCDLVRLLGAEEEAKAEFDAGSITFPSADGRVGRMRTSLAI